MQRVNQLIFFFINVLWAFSVLIAVTGSIFRPVSLVLIINLLIVGLIGLLQIYAGYRLYKGDLYLPIIATLIFLINWDLGGFKFINETLFYVWFIIGNNGIEINAQINDPTFLINLSFSNINFNYLCINLVTVIQLLLLLRQSEMLDDTKSKD